MTPRVNNDDIYVDDSTTSSFTSQKENYVSLLYVLASPSGAVCESRGSANISRSDYSTDLYIERSVGNESNNLTKHKTFVERLC